MFILFSLDWVTKETHLNETGHNSLLFPQGPHLRLMASSLSLEVQMVHSFSSRLHTLSKLFRNQGS